MKLFTSKVLTLALLGTSLLTGCDDPPPDHVHAEGHTEELARDIPVEAPPPSYTPVLEDGKKYTGMPELSPKLRRVDLKKLVDAGLLTVESNSPASGPVTGAFDGDEKSLAKSEQVNPFILTMRFTEPVSLRAVRILSSYSDYDWAVHPEGGERFIVTNIPDNTWSVVNYSKSVQTSKITVEVLRKTRDHFVHVNEIEVYE
jgi:hypothetical protein